MYCMYIGFGFDVAYKAQRVEDCFYYRLIMIPSSAKLCIVHQLTLLTACHFLPALPFHSVLLQNQTFRLTLLLWRLQPIPLICPWSGENSIGRQGRFGILEWGRHGGLNFKCRDTYRGHFNRNQHTLDYVPTCDKCCLQLSLKYWLYRVGQKSKPDYFSNNFVYC